MVERNSRAAFSGTLFGRFANKVLSDELCGLANGNGISHVIKLLRVIPMDETGHYCIVLKDH